ncbi:unnamed protein product [Closterium sp. NIES-54]
MTGFKRPEEALLGGAAAGEAAGAAGRGAAAAGRAGGEAPGVGVLSLAMARSCQVVFPQPWRQFWAWHALSQAQQVNSAHLKFDWDAYDFSAPCREGEMGGGVCLGSSGRGMRCRRPSRSIALTSSSTGMPTTSAPPAGKVRWGEVSAWAVLGVACAVAGPAGQLRPPQV